MRALEEGFISPLRRGMIWVATVSVRWATRPSKLHFKIVLGSGMAIRIVPRSSVVPSKLLPYMSYPAAFKAWLRAFQTILSEVVRTTTVLLSCDKEP